MDEKMNDLFREYKEIPSSPNGGHGLIHACMRPGVCTDLSIGSSGLVHKSVLD